MRPSAILAAAASLGLTVLAAAPRASDADFAAGQTATSSNATRAITAATRDADQYIPDLKALTTSAAASSELRELVERFTTDRGILLRFYTIASPVRRARVGAFYKAWQGHLRDVAFEKLGVEGRIDYVLLQNHLANSLLLLDREARNASETAPLLPFADTITGLLEQRRLLEPIDGRKAAATLDLMAAQIDATRKMVEALAAPAGRGSTTPDTSSDSVNGGGGNGSGGNGSGRSGGGPSVAARTQAANPSGVMSKPSKVVAWRAAEQIVALRRAQEDWFKHYASYDPSFTWWTDEPNKRVVKGLGDYEKILREKVVGARPGEDAPIVGDPIGRDALLSDLASELIPYTPEDLIAIANREFEWCEAEMKKASREMGFGDDWKAALEKVKTLHREPGDQPALVRDLAREAIDFLQKKDLVTVPPMAADLWRMAMMSPEMQKQAPFFLGGETILVAFPTETMAHEDKVMSLRANNEHFARATVHHELIPGHHLQGFMTQRYNTHRRPFGTPFWTEGWALYWEMLLWDQGFPRSPEDRVGMLFWRMHRCARIIFSLNFHLGQMTPQECIDFLVDRVGHERNSATGEVRRSFQGNYGPLYQAAYMLGGLQFRELHRQLVGDGKQTGGGKMSNREFHDRILQGGPMPVEMVRARLLNQPPAREHKAQWKFSS